MTQNLTQATQPATRDQQIRLVITMNVQGKNRLNRFSFLDFDFVFLNRRSACPEMHRVASPRRRIVNISRMRVVLWPRRVGQCTTGPLGFTRQEFPGALKSVPSAILLHPASGDSRPWPL
ncbi:hypothetical protein [Afipia felis]